jgi:hypothetical protein
MHPVFINPETVADMWLGNFDVDKGKARGAPLKNPNSNNNIGIKVMDTSKCIIMINMIIAKKLDMHSGIL